MNDDFEVPAPQSQLDFLVSAIGGEYIVLLMLSALVAFGLTLLLAVRGKGPFAAAALLLIVPLPMYVGAYGALQAWIATYQAIAETPVAPRPSVWANGIGSTSIRITVSMFLAGPSLMVAIVGSSIRAWLARSDET